MFSRGDLARYHPVIGLPNYIRVRILCEPYELGDGSLITQARGLDDGRKYYPCLDALSSDDPGT